ncbi:MAG TPA: dihydrofolate reductase [Vicinamibacterales bacterium]|jgi:dihydrofolate reductase|nr:dihydrofolate reductase [Vicinamibacterales bacterium]
MIVVGAMSSSRVIGSGNGMPWNVPEEYDHFLHLIEGKTIIIGRKSYEIFGNNLSSRHNIVVSRSRPDIDGAIVVPSIERAMQVAKSLGGDYFSAGGAAIYAQTIPLADTMYLSYIKGQFTGDAYFPEFSEEEWSVARREDHPRFEFVVYRRRLG